jgi:hypothetical protein
MTTIKPTVSRLHYPITRVVNNDTVVIMTIQQGKEMNKQFVILKENIKNLNKNLDTVHAINTFLVEYNQNAWETISMLKVENKELNAKIGQLSDKITTLSESNINLIRKSEMDLLRVEMYKNNSDAKIDLYKNELEEERRKSHHIAKTSTILGGLIVGGVAITGALIGSWMPSSWFK